ncbi:dialkylrecorsinol condensing enzyme [Neisseria shayeganii]|uniref:Dialkylresorcinol condensing enzyme n=1 Tax=Neisseria shayeganii TaxID=607712 RepID=A0A7D7NCN9_9NEIS|nr:dialkylrecorsinol condensing enzyme [Neisseria shayeganii]QMT40958.1 dialkylresorcinol condensing enzyme [Neisseria shayeganii]
MSKHVLLVSYSQTGQLSRLCDSFVRDLAAADDIHVERLVLQPERPFAFPWRFMDFFNTFPETVHLRPAPNRPFSLARERYDLVIIAYTVWFLSPAQPITAFLQSAQAAKVLRHTPVVTLIGCRNMWLMAQEKTKKLLDKTEARLVGNVVKIDQCSSAASFITTPLWMLTGRKKAVSWLPEAGISEAEIEDAARFGRRIAEQLRSGGPLDETLLQGMGAVKVNEKLILSERFAHRSFYLWGKLIMAAGRRSPLLRRAMVAFYVVFLIAIILTVVPVSALLKRLLAPLMRDKIRREKAYYSWPSGE